MRSINVGEDELIMLNISGVHYQLQMCKLHKFPGALLDTLAAKTEHITENADNEKDDKDKNKDLKATKISKPTENNDYIFIQRTPQMFELIVLQMYVTGKLHVPKWMCPESVLDELKFWQLDTEHACSCCEVDETSQDDTSMDLDNTQSSIDETKPMLSQWEKFRRRAWDFCDKPSSSIPATIFAVFSLLFVFLSIAIFVAGSIKTNELCAGNETTLTVNTNSNNVSSEYNKIYFSSSTFHNNSNTDTLLILNSTQKTTNNDLSTVDNNEDTADDIPVFFSNCWITQILQILEMTCVIWFTVELLTRLSVCPSWRKFFRHPLNLIDILATAPFYIEIALAYMEYHTPSMKRFHGIFVLIRVLRCLRVFRILKLARYFEELRILGKTLKSAKDELCMLGLFVFITVFIFSSIMYQLEKDEPDTQYTSLPASCWWGIVTLTTVGYGDMSPKTIGGKVLASVACVAGIIITAFPVSILVEHFTIAYKNKSQPMFLIRRLNMSGKENIKSDSASNIIARKGISV